MRKLLVIILVFILGLLSCNDQKELETIEVDLTESSVLLEIKSIMPLAENLFEYTEKRTSNLIHYNYNSIIGESKMVSYYDTPIIAVYTPIASIDKTNETAAHIYFELDGLVSDFEIIITEEALCQEITRFFFKDINGSKIAMFDVINDCGSIDNIELSTNNKNYFNRWTNCVRYILNQLVLNPADGLICMAFGKYCAGTVAAACAIAAAEGYFKEPNSP